MAFNEAKSIGAERAKEIKHITHKWETKERNRIEALTIAGTQTTIGAKYFEKKPGGGMADMNSSRGSTGL